MSNANQTASVEDILNTINKLKGQQTEAKPIWFDFPDEDHQIGFLKRESEASESDMIQQGDVQVIYRQTCEDEDSPKEWLIALFKWHADEEKYKFYHIKIDEQDDEMPHTLMVRTGDETRSMVAAATRDVLKNLFPTG